LSKRVIIHAIRPGLFALIALGLAGCGAVAAPCRVGSAAIKIVPLVGHVAAAPTDACAGAIDPS
jgi:hypothetical protein